MARALNRMTEMHAGLRFASLSVKLRRHESQARSVDRGRSQSSVRSSRTRLVLFLFAAQASPSVQIIRQLTVTDNGLKPTPRERAVAIARRKSEVRSNQYGILQHYVSRMCDEGLLVLRSPMTATRRQTIRGQGGCATGLASRSLRSSNLQEKENEPWPTSR